MTKEQEQIITCLLLKHGTMSNVLDKWVVTDPCISEEESDAIYAWGGCETREAQNGILITPQVSDWGGRWLTVQSDLDAYEND